MWLNDVKTKLGDNLKVNWRYFSLEQVNQKVGPEWKLWEQPEDYTSRGRLAFRAASAARQQGPEAFERFHLALLRSRHENQRDVAQIETLIDAATTAGLDVERFRADLKDRSLDERLAHDHTQAVDEYGTFGTPTFVFPNGNAAYVRMRPVAPPDQTMETFDSLRHLMEDRPYIQEVKRPVPPGRA